MSIQAMTWALSVKTGSPSLKVTLLALANYAGPTGKCWPSQEILSKQTDQSVDTVQRRLFDLEEMGLISREERPEVNGRKQNGDGGKYFYFLTLPDYAAYTTPQSAARSGSPQKKGNHAAKKTRAHRTVAVSNEPLQEKPIQEKPLLSVEIEFEKFWSIYPPRNGNPRKTAFEKFKAILNKGVDPNEIIRGTKIYAAWRAKEAKPQFTLMAATFLHQERWKCSYDSGGDEDRNVSYMEIAEELRNGGRYDERAYDDQRPGDLFEDASVQSRGR
jgi:hypothetical protein